MNRQRKITSTKIKKEGHPFPSCEKIIRSLLSIDYPEPPRVEIRTEDCLTRYVHRKCFKPVLGAKILNTFAGRLQKIAAQCRGVRNTNRYERLFEMLTPEKQETILVGIAEFRRQQQTMFNNRLKCIRYLVKNALDNYTASRRRTQLEKVKLFCYFESEPYAVLVLARTFGINKTNEFVMSLTNGNLCHTFLGLIIETLGSDKHNDFLFTSVESVLQGRRASIPVTTSQWKTIVQGAGVHGKSWLKYKNKFASLLSCRQIVKYIFSRLQGVQSVLLSILAEMLRHEQEFGDFMKCHVGGSIEQSLLDASSLALLIVCILILFAESRWSVFFARLPVTDIQNILRRMKHTVSRYELVLAATHSPLFRLFTLGVEYIALDETLRDDIMSVVQEKWHVVRAFIKRRCKNLGPNFSPVRPFGDSILIDVQDSLFNVLFPSFRAPAAPTCTSIVKSWHFPDSNVDRLLALTQ